VDKIIKRNSTTDPRKTANDIACELKQGNYVTVSRRIVLRRLNDVGLMDRVAVKKPFLRKKTQEA
jgi:Transposase.